MTLEDQQAVASVCINHATVGGIGQVHCCLLKSNPNSRVIAEPGPCLPLVLNKLCPVLERLTPCAGYRTEPVAEPEGDPPDFRLLDRQRGLVRHCVNHCIMKDEAGRQYNQHGCLLASPAKPCRVHQGKLCDALSALFPIQMAAPDVDESEDGEL
ncbi:MAG: hypothetical protein ACLQBD_01960 [Syntrophobacteraceae bacterium]